MKYINFKRYYFSTVAKSLNTLRYNFIKIFKFVNFSGYNLKTIYKYLDVRRYNFTKILKYFNPKTYSINRFKKINFIGNKFLKIHLPASIIFFGFLYLVIPTFYNYDKSDIEKLICKKQNIECIIQGKVNYRFYPTPRILIKDLIVNDFFKKKRTLITAENTAVKLSIKNLLAKEKQKFKKIELNNFEINLNLENWKKYKSIFSKKTNLIPVTFVKGKVLLFDKNDYVATISDSKINLKFVPNSINFKLWGKILNDKIHINLNSERIDNSTFSEFLLKMSNLNLLTKASFINSEKDKNVVSGNVLIKQDKNKITAIIDYKDNKIVINKSNLRNTFIDGKMEGIITILPYFNFNLDVNLNSINFTKLYSYFLSLDNNQRKEIFKINKKINGELILASDKIYSSYNLIKSFESNLKFNNGKISIKQFLINLGKLGAADILGTINDDKKFSNLKFESNVFVDNQKKFLSKFGIYNKKNISSNFFVSGNFDLDNLRMSFYEISNDEKLSNEDVNYVEKEFNDLMLGEGYKSLFYFPTFKEFIRSISDETN